MHSELEKQDPFSDSLHVDLKMSNSSRGPSSLFRNWNANICSMLKSHVTVYNGGVLLKCTYKVWTVARTDRGSNWVAFCCSHWLANVFIIREQGSAAGSHLLTLAMSLVIQKIFITELLAWNQFMDFIAFPFIAVLFFYLCQKTHWFEENGFL